MSFRNYVNYIRFANFPSNLKKYKEFIKDHIFQPVCKDTIPPDKFL